MGKIDLGRLLSEIRQYLGPRLPAQLHRATRHTRQHQRADRLLCRCRIAPLPFFHKPGEPLTTEATQRLRPEVHKALTNLHDDLVFIKTHNANLAVHNIPLCTPAHTAGAIVILRDPRDIALSYSAFIGKPLDDIITFMANPRAANRATDIVQVFEFHPPGPPSGNSRPDRATNKFLIRYEDLLADPEKHFARIIDYLGGPPEPERLRRAIAFSDFKILATQEIPARLLCKQR